MFIPYPQYPVAYNDDRNADTMTQYPVAYNDDTDYMKACRDCMS